MGEITARRGDTEDWTPAPNDGRVLRALERLGATVVQPTEDFDAFLDELDAQRMRGSLRVTAGETVGVTSPAQGTRAESAAAALVDILRGQDGVRPNDAMLALADLGYVYHPWGSTFQRVKRLAGVITVRVGRGYVWTVR